METAKGLYLARAASVNNKEKTYTVALHKVHKNLNYISSHVLVPCVSSSSVVSGLYINYNIKESTNWF